MGREANQAYEVEPVSYRVSTAVDRATPSARQVAERVGVSPGALGQWRSGSRIPTPANVRALQAALATQARELMHAARDMEMLAEQLERPTSRRALLERRATPPGQTSLLDELG